MSISRPTLMGLAAVLMWSTIAVGFKLGLRSMDPIQLLWLGSCFSWVLFTVCVVVLPSQPFERSSVVRALLLGLINPLLYYLVLLTAYDLLPRPRCTTLELHMGDCHGDASRAPTASAAWTNDTSWHFDRLRRRF